MKRALLLYQNSSQPMGKNQRSIYLVISSHNEMVKNIIKGGTFVYALEKFQW